MVKKFIRANLQKNTGVLTATTAQPSADSRSARSTQAKRPTLPDSDTNTAPQHRQSIPPHTSQALEHPTAQQPNMHRPASSKLSFEPVKCTGRSTPSAGTPKQLQYATLGLLHEILHGVFFTV